MRLRIGERLSPPWITIALAIGNAGIFVYSLVVSPLTWERFVYAYGARPFELRHLHDIKPTIDLPAWTPVVSAWLINDGWLAIASTIICLAMLAPAVERALGSGWFLGVYAAAGVITVVALVLLHPDATQPMAGAIGPVFGCLGAYMSLFPGRWRSALALLAPYVTLLGLQYFDVIGALGAVTVRTTGDTFIAAGLGFAIGLVLARVARLTRDAALPHLSTQAA